MGFDSPYRQPCSPWASTPSYLGQQNQHYNEAENGKQIVQNLTTILGGAAPSAQVAITQPDACSAGQTVVIYENCYKVQTPTAYKDYATCCKRGFKNLAAGKIWQGRFPFTTASTGDTCATYPATPIQTKYRTKAMISGSLGAVSQVKSSLGVITTLGTSTSSRTYTVAKNSGRVSETAKSDSGTGTYSSPGYSSELQACLQMDYACDVWACSASGLGGDIVTALNDPSAPSTLPSDAFRGVVVESRSMSATIIAFSVTRYSSGGAGDLWASNHYDVIITLSDPYTGADLDADINAALGQVDMADVALYPWRSGGNGDTCAYAPYVTYDDVGGTPDQFSAYGDTFSDTRAGRWTDQTGTPVPATGGYVGLFVPAGYDAYWDKTARIYADDILTGYGAYAPDWCPHATQWFDTQMAKWGSNGAWLNYNSSRGLGGYPFGDRAVKCIWAEVLMFAKPSHNFARPCGSADAAAINQVTATCSGGVLSGSPLFSGVPSTCPVPPTGGYEWNDTDQKGDFIFKEWQYDTRDSILNPGSYPYSVDMKAFYATQACISHVPCCPNVAMICPSGLTYGFTNVAYYGMRSFGSGIDETLGTYWQARPEQWMKDPLWQPPQQCPVEVVTPPWQEDDGTGTTGQYFPPFEEARVAVPSGAPSYPSGFGVNYSGYVAYWNSTGNEIPECQAPQLGVCHLAGRSEVAPWIAWDNQVVNCTWDIPPEECAAFEP